MEQTKKRVPQGTKDDSRFPSGMTERKASDHPLQPSWETSATAENAALASVALEEERNPNRLIEATYALSVSPMFVLLCRDFVASGAGTRGQWRKGKGSGQSEEQREFEVRLFASRMYLAGLRTNRLLKPEWMVEREGGGL